MKLMVCWIMLNQRASIPSPVSPRRSMYISGYQQQASRSNTTSLGTAMATTAAEGGGNGRTNGMVLDVLAIGKQNKSEACEIWPKASNFCKNHCQTRSRNKYSIFGFGGFDPRSMQDLCRFLMFPLKRSCRSSWLNFKSLRWHCESAPRSTSKDSDLCWIDSWWIPMVYDLLLLLYYIILKMLH